MKTYTYEKTNDPKLFRVVDRAGNWTTYVWSPGTPEERFLWGVTSTLHIGFSKGPRFYEYLKNGSKDDLERKLKEAGERGDRVHQYIARYLSGEKMDRFTKVRDDNGQAVELSDDEWDAVLSFGEFWTRHDCALVAHEFSVYDLKIGYAGTVDVVARIRKDCGNRYCACKKFIGKLGLLDWKSGGGIYPDHGAQVAAYSHAENLLKVLGGRKIAFTGIVRIGTKHKTTGGCEFEPYSAEETAEHFSQFLAADRIRDTLAKPFDPETEIKDVPEALGFKVQRDVAPKPKKSRKPRKGTKVAKRKKPQA